MDLLVFIVVTTGLVHATRHRFNPDIGTYADAPYVTITSLTTAGFGDTTLPGTTAGTTGRMLSGLQRHEPDKVRSKACGTTLRIPNEGGD